MYVVAYDSAGNKVGKTVSSHVAGKDSKKYKNPKSVKLTTKTLTLTTGQTSKVKATVRMEKGKNKELSLSDVYFLDTNKWIWKKVITIDQPLPRFYHAGAKVKDHSVYFYGGIHVGRTSKLLSDLHIYDYSK